MIFMKIVKSFLSIYGHLHGFGVYMSPAQLLLQSEIIEYLFMLTSQTFTFTLHCFLETNFCWFKILKSACKR